MERIFVTGAQGFQGRYLIAHLLKTCSNATVFGNGRSHRMDDTFTHYVHWGIAQVLAPIPNEIREAFDSPRYHYASLDIQRQSDLARLLREFRPDTIFHLASALRDSSADQLFRTNVEGTISLIEAIREAGIGVPKLIHASSGFVYGRPPSVPIAESTPCAPFDLYGVSKLAAEHASRSLAEKYGIPTLWVRIFNLVGPGQDERHFCGAIASKAAAIADGNLPPAIAIEPLTATRDFIDVRDAARALQILGEHGRPGEVYNLASGIEVSIANAFENILRLASIRDRVEIERMPGRLADVQRYVADISALNALGFRLEVSLDQSILDLLEWYRTKVKPAASAPKRERRSHLNLTIEADAQYRYAVRVEAGLIESVPGRLCAMFPGAFFAVLTDTRVHRLHGEHFLQTLRAEGIRTEAIIISEGENSKSEAKYLDIVHSLYALRFDRRAVLVNFGGGLISDIGGFVAATYMRGVPYINIPTSLLGQHDSCIGGKVAVNMPWAKNFLGAFYHPRAVFCDPELLATLSKRNLSSGIAEVLKVAIICDAGLFELLETEYYNIREARDASLLAEVVSRTIKGKAALLAHDPYENNLRRALNLGHTFGHPLEVQTRYTLLFHGEAVAFGLAVATSIARRRKLCSSSTAERIYKVLSLYDLPPIVPLDSLTATCKRLEEVRLVRGQNLNFVMPRTIGRVEIVPEISDREMIEALQDIAADPLIGGCVGTSVVQDEPSHTWEFAKMRKGI